MPFHASQLIDGRYSIHTVCPAPADNAPQNPVEERTQVVTGLVPVHPLHVNHQGAPSLAARRELERLALNSCVPVVLLANQHFQGMSRAYRMNCTFTFQRKAPLNPHRVLKFLRVVYRSRKTVLSRNRNPAISLALDPQPVPCELYTYLEKGGLLSH